MKKNLADLIAISMTIVIFSVVTFSQTTEFTYQGSLKDGAAPANANYDFEFALFDALSGGNQIGSTIPKNNVPVANGIFSVKLDFGAAFPGTDRFLEIRVRLAGQPGITTLAPRQLVNSAPYSVKSLNADNAASASNAAQLGGVAASQYVITTDPRMMDARAPTAGSGNYIQNQSAATQASSNFNISGNGMAGGTFSGNIISATTQYNIGSNRVLSVAGFNNLFAGIGAGQNTTGGENAFVGAGAGQSNTTGFRNAFFGDFAGRDNTTGQDNSVFGAQSGKLLGASQQNSFFGSSSGGSATGTANSFFGALSGDSSTSGSFNSFFEAFSGRSNAAADNNSFFGYAAGSANTGANNSFFGVSSGQDNTGTDNAFFGVNTGRANTSGNRNSFFGRLSGRFTTTGSDNTTVGYGAGNTNTTGSNNTVIGASADVGANNLAFATAIGSGVVVSASNTVMVGRPADTVQIPGNLNVTGNLTATLPAGSGNYIQNQNTGPQVSSNFNISGNGTAAGNLTAGEFRFTNGRAIAISGTSLFAGPLTGNTGSQNAFFGSNAGEDNNGGANNAYFGFQAGNSNVTGSNNAYFGGNSASNLVSGNNNAFFGTPTGFGINVSATRVSLFGSGASGSDGLTNATAIGSQAFVGQNNSLVLGSIAGVNGATDNTNVGIGTANPTKLLTIGEPETTTASAGVGVFTTTGTNIVVRETTNDIENIFGASSSNGGLFGTTTNHNVNFRTNNANRLRILSTGEIVIFNLGAAGGTSLCINGSSQISSCSSSLRYKTNVGQFSSGLSFVNKLRPISFEWKDGGMKDVGFGAEDVAKIDPRFVTYNSAGEVEGVKYDRLSVAFVNAFKEQQAQIEAQQKQIETLTRALCSLKVDLEVCKQK